MDVRRADDGLFVGEEAVDLAKRALAGGVLLREGGVAWINATNVLLGAGDIGRVRDLYDEANRRGTTTGRPLQRRSAPRLPCLAGVMAGDLLDAETDLREALGLSEAIGLRAGLPYQAGLARRSARRKRKARGGKRCSLSHTTRATGGRELSLRVPA
jgi:hypothetical protein